MNQHENQALLLSINTLVRINKNKAYFDMMHTLGYHAFVSSIAPLDRELEWSTIKTHSVDL